MTKAGFVVRRGVPADRVAVRDLLQRARRLLLWPWPWETALAHTGDRFLLLVRGGRVRGALLAEPDDAPIAWVRLAAVVDEQNVDDWLRCILPLLLEALGREGLGALLWLDHAGWGRELLPRHGFQPLLDVLTLEKGDRALPVVPTAAGDVRAPGPADLPAVYDLERAAYTPHWWVSQQTLRAAWQQAGYARVLVEGEQVIAYAAGTLSTWGHAHLDRLTVRKDRQGRGIGAHMLAHALRWFWEQGAQTVSLNTQENNVASLHLYRRFGFSFTGDRATAWQIPLWNPVLSGPRA